jgi:hypothetical protein
MFPRVNQLGSYQISLNRLENAMTTIWGRLKEMGWFFAAKAKTSLLFLNYPNPAPWCILVSATIS